MDLPYPQSEARHRLFMAELSISVTRDSLEIAMNRPAMPDHIKEELAAWIALLDDWYARVPQMIQEAEQEFRK